MSIKSSGKPVLFSLFVSSFLYSISTHAAFFQLAENSPAGLGNAFAGGAAIAEDASTVWYNPAGLTRLSGTEYIVGGYAIVPSTKFDKQSATIHPALGGTAITGGNGGDAGEAAIIPNFYFSHQIDDRTTFGLGVNVPFGLATEYDDDWVGRYHAIRSEIKTININPAIGYKLSSDFSFGAGFSLQYVEATLSQKIDTAAACILGGGGGACAPLGAPQSSDAKFKLQADDSTFGYNFGFLWQPSKDTRAGIAYRSAMRHKVRGEISDLDAPSAAAAGFLTGTALLVEGGGVNAETTFPATASLSVFHQLNQQWAVMGDVTQTRWARLPELRIKFDSGANDSVVTLDLENVYRYSVGANYSPSGPWVYRFGVAYDESPAPSASLRTPRAPDEDRKWFSFGIGYNKSTSFSFDAAYTYVKVDDAKINKSTTNTENATRGNLIGTYEADVHLLSAQLRWLFK